MESSRTSHPNTGNSSDLRDLAQCSAPAGPAAPSRVEAPDGVLVDSVLPDLLRKLFWDCQFDELRLTGDLPFIVGRVLSSGSWSQIGWLREKVGDDGLRQWICQRAGRPLNPRQLRFWELILDLPSQQVNEWLANGSRSLWDWRNFREMGQRDMGPMEAGP